MSISSLLIILAAFIAFSGNCQSSSRFRSGVIVSSTLDDCGAASAEGSRTANLVLTVMLDPGRSLGVHDYVLLFEGDEYRCGGISKEGDEFTSEDELLAGKSEGTKFRLLFKVKIKDSKESYSPALKFNLFNSGLCRTDFSVKDTKFSDQDEAGKPLADKMIGTPQVGAKGGEAAPQATAPPPPAPASAAASKIEMERLNAEIASASEKARSQAGAQPGPAAAAVPPERTMDINTARRDELLSLPGIGEGTVDRIIAGRPYKAIEDILSIKGVRKGNYDKFAPHLRIGGN